MKVWARVGLVVALALGLWCNAGPALARYGLRNGLGLAAVVLVIAWGIYLLASTLGTLHLARVALRAPAVRRSARRLVFGNAMASLALAEEALRLSDAFWLGCALVPASLMAGLLLKLHRARRPIRVDWESYGRLASRPQSFPEVHVTATASLLHSTRGAGASVSVDLGTMG